MKQYDNKIQLFIKKLEEADAILVGAASGMSAASGYRHYYERDEMFVDIFGEFEKKYGFHNTFNGAYYRYGKITQKWAFMSKLICTILDAPVGKTYKQIEKILEGKEFHILTTNQDIQFTHIYDEKKISAIQGDWRYLQCSQRCHDELYDSVDIMHRLQDSINENLEVKEEMIPRCPKCHSYMAPWVRDPIFLEGKKYHEEYQKVRNFLDKYKDKKIVFLELGVGRMTPMFIQEPFWNLTYQLPQAFYITINPQHALVPEVLQTKALAIQEDILKVFDDVLEVLHER